MPSSPEKNATVEARVNQVAEWMITGCGNQKIYARTRDLWGVSSRQTDEYIKRARKIFRQAADMKREDLVSLSMAQFDHIVEKSLECKQFSAAQAALVSKLRMVGCDAPKGL